MRKWLMVSALCFAFVLPSAAWGAGGGPELPGAVPSDLPFPDGASLKIKTMSAAAGKQYLVSFSFSGDADAVYKDFKEFAVSHGYEIGVETDYRFDSFHGSSGKGLTVDIQAMGSVNIGTVSVLAPKK